MENLRVPDGLPTLSGGGHQPNSGQACFMEMASMLAGEKWSDHPACTHPVIAVMARNINDWLPADRRHEIAELIPSVIGTADLREDAHERKVLLVRLAVWCARQVLHLVREQDRAVCKKAIDAAEGRCDGTVTVDEVRSAANAAAYAAANAANATSASMDLPGLLRGLIAEHARLTGHTVQPEVEETWASADFDALVKVGHV